MAHTFWMSLAYVTVFEVFVDGDVGEHGHGVEVVEAFGLEDRGEEIVWPVDLLAVEHVVLVSDSYLQRVGGTHQRDRPRLRRQLQEVVWKPEEIDLIYEVYEEECFDG